MLHAASNVTKINDGAPYITVYKTDSEISHFFFFFIYPKFKEKGKRTDCDFLKNNK